MYYLTIVLTCDNEGTSAKQVTLQVLLAKINFRFVLRLWELFHLTVWIKPEHSVKYFS